MPDHLSLDRLAMVLVVVAVAANGYRLAGYLAAVSTAAWFDFFLTRPCEQFNITRRNDIETTVLLRAWPGAGYWSRAWSGSVSGPGSPRRGWGWSRRWPPTPRRSPPR